VLACFFFGGSVLNTELIRLAKSILKSKLAWLEEAEAEAKKSNRNPHEKMGYGALGNQEYFIDQFKRIKDDSGINFQINTATVADDHSTKVVGLMQLENIVMRVIPYDIAEALEICQSMKIQE
jgi:hypothetical protein